MYAFFLDIDGTLFDGERVSDGVIDAINRARSLGHKVFINTARAYVAMPEELYGLSLDGYVNSFGLEIFADGRFIHRNFMSKRVVRRIARYALKHGVSLYFEGEGSIGINRHREGSLDITNMRELRRALKNTSYCKVSLNPKTSERDRAILGKGYNIVSGDIIPVGYSKAYGIELVEKYYGLSHDFTVAIGDTDPDIEMIRYAGIGVSMGNGTEGLKNTVKYLTRTVGEDGVAYAIDRIISGDLAALKKQGTKV